MTTRYNTSIYHNILGFFNGLKNKVTWFNLYRKTYSNYLTPNEINKLSFEDQIKRVDDPKSKEFHGKFWKKWSLIK